MKKKLVFLFLVLFAFTNVNAQFQNVKKDKVNYVLKDGKAYIIGFDEKATKVTIEASITYKKQTYKVVGVSSSDYYNSYSYNKGKTTYLREMIFAEGITEVFDEIAKNMDVLEKVVLSSTITSIGRKAFWGCKSLSEINIPNSVKKIDFLAFAGCTSLQQLELPEGLQELGGSVFSGCTSLKKINLPQTITAIGKEAFYKCTSLQEIVIPHMVKSLGNKVFYGCANLSSAIILCDIKEIPESFFNGCNSLESVVIPNSVKVCGLQSFKDCTSLKDIVLPDDAKYFTDEVAARIKKNNVYKGTFSGCNVLTNIKCHSGSIPADILTYIPVSCPFAQNGGKSKNPDFDTALLASIAKHISGDTTGFLYAHQQKQVLASDVDISIPETKAYNDTTFAIIIGNENYKLVPPVSYAEHDAKIFAEYCKKTLGLPEKNVNVFYDASYGEMIKAINLLKMLSKAYEGKFNVIFYYSGHGVPNESTRDAYLLPVDADGSLTEVCYALSKLYKDLVEVKANRILVFLDACFSGAQRDGGVLQASARGVAIKAKPTEPTGKMVVFSAATDDETAYPLEGKSHGLFTYYLLKKIKETQGSITLGDLANYIKTNVMNTSITENKKRQTPTITPSNSISPIWTTMKLY